MTSASDLELAGLAAGGDERAFTRLLERHYGLIFKVAFKWCGDRHEAEDIAQDVCVKLARSIGGFDGRSKFRTWLYRITINTAKDRHKARTRYAPEAQSESAAATPNWLHATEPERHARRAEPRPRRPRRVAGQAPRRRDPRLRRGFEPQGSGTGARLRGDHDFLANFQGAQKAESYLERLKPWTTKH